MRAWVVTGPVGAGKSTVARLLQRHGAALLDADKLGHESGPGAWWTGRWTAGRWGLSSLPTGRPWIASML